MGRRSRKRSQGAPATASSRAERDAARRERARRGPAKAQPTTRARPSMDDRPPPLWGAFPLTELVTLAGIVLMAWGFFSEGGRSGNAKIGAGLAIASIAGLELAIREHVTGFRSHTTLLSGAVAILAIVVLGLGAGLDALGVLLLAGAAAFTGSFVGLRELFKRRSGGLSFR
jgi:hypothetical protein